VRVAVVGVEDERPLFEEMLARGATAVTDLVGQTSLQEFYVLAGRAAVVIGNDAGTTHVAAASGAPTIAIFGHTDFIGYRPLGPRVTVLRHPVTCAPCLYWFDRSACEKAHICLHGVQPEQVVAEAKRWLSNGRRRARAPAGVREASP
jgi:heptosyltransferase-2